MRLIVTIDSPDDLSRPGVPLAQTIRETATVIEMMVPLIPGILTDRISGKTKATWLVGSPVVTAPVITVYGPNPAPPNSEFGMSITGNFFPTDAEVYFDGVPAPVTSVYSQWSITGTGPALPAGPHECMLVCSGLGYAHFDWTFGNPVDTPTLTSLSPNPVAVGADMVNCDGTGFTVDMKVVVDGALAAATQLISPTRVTGVLAGAPAIGAHPVLVRAAGYDTPPIDWVITAAPVYPTLTSLVPNPTPSGPGTITLDCIGTGFTAESKIIVNGATSTTELISPTNLRTNVGNSGTPASLPVLVRTPGAPDTAVIQWVFEAGPPKLTSLVPNPTTADGASVLLEVYGTDFRTDTTVLVQGVSHGTIFVSATKLTSTVPKATAAGQWDVKLQTPGFSGYSNSIAWVFEAPSTAPTLISIVPNPTPANGGTDYCRCYGTGFVEGSQIFINGVVKDTWVLLPTDLMTRNTVTKPNAPGTWQVFVRSPGLPDTATVDWVFSDPALTPALISLAPNPAPLTPDPATIVTLICTGVRFTAASKVVVNGRQIETTVFNTATQLTASFDNASAVDVTWTVIVRTPGLPDTEPVGWVVGAGGPAPTLTSLDPNPTPPRSSSVVGYLDYHGTNFTKDSKTVINDAPDYPTVFNSPTHLTAIFNGAPLSGASWPATVRTPGFPDTAAIQWVTE